MKQLLISVVDGTKNVGDMTLVNVLELSDGKVVSEHVQIPLLEAISEEWLEEAIGEEED